MSSGLQGSLLPCRHRYIGSPPKNRYAARAKSIIIDRDHSALSATRELLRSQEVVMQDPYRDHTLLRVTEGTVEETSPSVVPAPENSKRISSSSSMAGQSDTSRIIRPAVEPGWHQRASRRQPKLWAPGQEKWFTEPLTAPIITSPKPPALSRSKWYNIDIMGKANKQLGNTTLSGKAMCIASARMLATITTPLLIPAAFLTTILFFIMYFPGQVLSTIMTLFTLPGSLRYLRYKKPQDSKLKTFQLDEKPQDSKLKTFKLDGRGRSKSNRNSDGCARCDLCGGCWYCTDCDQCIYCRFCEECSACKGCEWCNGCVDCVDCVNCIGCVGLRGAKGVTGGKA